eukprot:GHUV01043059.1.p1 GENE.GHUV01043059.1~~GHUV01043059.1.p1  ORF type:complete len:143 (+),score=14.36 GHUV01043059.1:149-577(+)
MREVNIHDMQLKLRMLGGKGQGLNRCRSHGQYLGRISLRRIHPAAVTYPPQPFADVYTAECAACTVSRHMTQTSQTSVTCQNGFNRCTAVLAAVVCPTSESRHNTSNRPLLLQVGWPLRCPTCSSPADAAAAKCSVGPHGGL